MNKIALEADSATGGAQIIQLRPPPCVVHDFVSEIPDHAKSVRVVRDGQTRHLSRQEYLEHRDGYFDVERNCRVKGARETGVAPDEAEAGMTSHEAPTYADPLRGLTSLGPIVVRGATRLRELAAEPIDWVWQDYAVGGTIVVIAGPSAEGKTTLLFMILLARATTGQPIVWNGHEIKPAPAGKYVVLVEAEHGDKSTARKLVKSAGLLRVGDEALDRIITVSRKAVILGSPEWKDIERMIAAGIVSDVALDTIARVAPGDGNSEKEQAAQFAIIADAIEQAPLDSQPVVWALAHTRKGAADTLADVSGSTQRVGQADTVLMVTAERNEAGQVIASTMKLLKPREEPERFPDPLVVRIQDGKLEISSDNGSGGKRALPADLKPLEEKILRFLGKQNEPRSANYITGALAKEKGGAKRSNGDIKSALEDLESAGHVRLVLEACEYKGKTSDGWEIAGTAKDPATEQAELNAAFAPR